MIRFELDVGIERPVAEVFGYITDVSNLPKWQSTAEGAGWTDHAPVGVGSQMRERRTFLGRTIETTLEVTAFERDRRFDLRAVSGPLPLAVRHEFQPAHGGTAIHVIAEGEASRLPRMAQRLAAKQAERQFKHDYERLKSLLES